MGLEVRSSVYLLVHWTRKKIVDAPRALEMLDDLTKEGYRLSSEDYIAIKDLIVGFHA